MRQPSGLLSTILLRIVPVAVLLLLAISLGANLLAERTVREEVEDRLLGDSATQALVISLTLGTLVDSTKTLAVNELIIDGVGDPANQPSYLKPLFRSLQIPGPPVRLTLANKMGQLIATNSEGTVSYQNEPWLASVMSGENFINLTQEGLTIAVPVLYLDAPEGLLVMEAGPPTVSGIVGAGLATSDGMLLGQGGEVIISSIPAIARVGDIDPGMEIKGWLQRRAAVPGFAGNTLVTMEPETMAFGPVRQVRKFLWGAMILDLFILLVGIGMTARLATRPVAELARAVGTIRGQTDLGEQVPQTGPSELRELSKVFNETLNDLRKTMDDRVRVEAENVRLQEEVRLNAELERRLRMFVSLASHELRTPTTAIMGFSELLLESEDNQKEWTATIHRNSVLLTGIVNDLLDITRIQSGTLTINKDEVSLAASVEETLTNFRSFNDQREFLVQIPENLPPLIADFDKLNQVLSNLIGNAVKYSPEGSAVIVSAVHDPELARAVISIRDEGFGIAIEDQKMLFTPFGRVNTPDTASIEGSGLGLYLVKELVEAMGGEVWVESIADMGSTFLFYLPTSATITEPEFTQDGG